MSRRFTAHDLADHARCPRAGWYERHHAWARLDGKALEAQLQARRTQLGRRARHDPETQLLLRLLERQGRFARGRQVHLADAASTGQPFRAGCLAPIGLLLALTLAMLVVALWG